MPNDSYKKRGNEAYVSDEADTRRLHELLTDAKEEQKILSLNAWHLGRYIIEHSKTDGDSDGNGKINIPESLDMGAYLVNAEKYPRLADDEKADFINQYVKLEKAAGQVTARTLYATRVHGKGFWALVFLYCGSRRKNLNSGSLIQPGSPLITYVSCWAHWLAEALFSSRICFI